MMLMLQWLQCVLYSDAMSWGPFNFHFLPKVDLVKSVLTDNSMCRVRLSVEGSPKGTTWYDEQSLHYVLVNFAMCNGWILLAN